MRLAFLVAAACLLAAAPAASADHDGESPLDCEAEPDNRVCADYCVHGMGISYRVSTSDPTKTRPDEICWVM